ncbi:hypothetical protein G9A89_011615 [Geosiphon pyriformis]|nr:hypothetical protein G9A89_011615 [Geosiphon pyriformis]
MSQIPEKLDTSQPFLFKYKTTVNSGIFVMKKVKKKSLSDAAVIDSSSRKKCKGGLLEESVKVVGISASGTSGGTAESVSRNTIESESVDIKKEYLVEKTSFQHKNREESGGNNTEIMPKSPKRVVIKCVFGKPLGTINFGMENDDDNNILNGKSFALNIDFMVVAGKSSQEKLAYVRKIFSKVNGFGGAFTLSKFGEIIQASFTSEKALLAAAKLANDHGVVVNTDLKCSINNYTNWAIVLKKIPVGTSVEAVRAVVSEFGKIKMIKIQLVGLWDNYRALLYTLPVEMTAHNLWDFIGSVGEKTCIIDCNSVTYTRAYCTMMCFDSEVNLVKAIAMTSVIKGVGLYWSCLSLALCSECKNSGYMFFTCKLVKVGSISRGRKAPLSAQNQFRLAKIYKKKSASISRPLAFSEKTWVLVVDTLFMGSLHSTNSFFGSIDDSKPLLFGMNDLKK